MTELFDNPMGTDGFEFVEYAAPDPQALRALFERLGFPVVARHRSKNVTRHAQGDINFIINAESGLLRAGLCPRARSVRLRHGLPGARCGVRL
jgi:4-hydroxyphenylpyruvate dioxygenase-like putative hemolysin